MLPAPASVCEAGLIAQERAGGLWVVVEIKSKVYGAYCPAKPQSLGGCSGSSGIQHGNHKL